jgi:hypothetical protein
MKVGRKSKGSFKSFEERIEGLKQEIKLLEELIPIYEYFKLTTEYQNSYIVEVRQIIAKELINKGVSPSEIARTLARNHATILHLLTVENSKEVKEEVALNYKDWMNTKVCPVTFTKAVPSNIHLNGWKHITVYKLKQLIP